MWRSSPTAVTAVRKPEVPACPSLLGEHSGVLGDVHNTHLVPADGAWSFTSANAVAGEEGWQPLFATPQRGKRTRLSDAPAAQPEAGAAAPDEQAHAAGVVTCAAATATTPAHAAGAALDAAPEPQPQQTPDLVKTALLPSPASSARVSHRPFCQDFRAVQQVGSCALPCHPTACLDQDQCCSP